MPGDAAAKRRRPAAPVIELTPVGTAAAFGGAGEPQSSYLVTAAGHAVLLDMGSGSLAALNALRPPETLDAVFITHRHPDHCVDLFALHVHMRWGPGRGRVLDVHCPADLPDRLAAFGDSRRWGVDEGIRFLPLDPAGGAVRVGPLSANYRRVPHVDPTFAIRLEHGGAALCFGADCAPNDALVELARGCDVLLAECAFGADPVPEGLPHLNADSAARMARRAGAGRLLLTHCQSGHDRERALVRAREVFGGRVDWARAGETVCL